MTAPASKPPPLLVFFDGGSQHGKARWFTEAIGTEFAIEGSFYHRLGDFALCIPPGDSWSPE